MSERAAFIKRRLQELAAVQKTRHLSEAELWEAADLLRTAGRETAAREAEAAALRQRAREMLRSPDATFSVDDETRDLDVFYCRVCGRQITPDQAEKLFYHCPSCHGEAK
jgi:rubrerythrin